MKINQSLTETEIGKKETGAMKRRFTRYVALATVTMMLAACATTDGGNANLTADQKALRDYTSDYTVTGAIGGALAGCLAGALLSNNKGAGCAGGAVVGGAIGAASGYYLAQRQRSVGQQSVDYAAERDALKQEVAKAQETLKSANRIVASTKSDIKQLKRQVASSQATNQQLQARLEIAKQDLEAMEQMEKKIAANIDQVKSDIQAQRGDSSNVAMMKTQLQKLESINKALKKDREQLEAEIIAAG